MIAKRLWALALAGACTFTPALADVARQNEFVEANIINAFYHELGHALIDTMELPVLAREEEAADAFSVLLIDELWPPEQAEWLSRDSARGWALSAATYKGQGTELWQIYALDMQRYYNAVCLWYGADPKKRRAFADDHALPRERAETCADEYYQSHKSWFGLLVHAMRNAPGDALVYEGDQSDEVGRIIKREIDRVNAHFKFPRRIRVVVESCNEANAYYELGTRRIQICREYADSFRQMARDSQM
ncbi:DUF4344 domain-containing metallopeptidase [Paracoccus sulfuroxidans]|uniref:Putative metallopeptidase DUF4344 n=1 Tax=Paracoccus sulfuroxidans TaxID=384678 RepID=A0A562NRZ3_9RHOB|nr:DUF4344 domain-containing metallopeptidase [Paracoccus sulfuroxidans]TWI34964.1 putative metallopeptidase DUF4344 [Paracoccus sulfuroxidans]